MIEWKGFTKLIGQLILLSFSMIAVSFFTDTQVWMDNFTFTHSLHTRQYCLEGISYSHWNYRGWVYVTTGLVLFVISVVKIIMSHDTKDFE